MPAPRPAPPTPTAARGPRRQRVRTANPTPHPLERLFSQSVFKNAAATDWPSCWSRDPRPPTHTRSTVPPAGRAPTPPRARSLPLSPVAAVCSKPSGLSPGGAPPRQPATRHAPFDTCSLRRVCRTLTGGPSTAPAHRAPPSGGNAPRCPQRERRAPCSPPGPLGPASAVPHLLSASQTCGALPCASARAEAARTRPGFRGGLRVSCRWPARRPAHAVLPNGVPREATRDQAVVTNGSHWVQAHLAPLADGRQKSRRPVCEDPLGGEKAASTVLSIR